MRATARPVPLWALGVGFWGLVALVAAGRHSPIVQDASLTTFGVVFSSIVVEALPFILIGAAVSAALAAWVPDAAFARAGRLPAAVQVPVAAMAGVALPVCECGSIPVARRLIARGLQPGAGVAFMLAAPIVNPVVLGSTWVAYAGRGKALEMTAGRAGLGLLVAALVGLVLGGRGVVLLRAGAAAGPGDHQDHAGHHDHDHDHAGHDHAGHDHGHAGHDHDEGFLGHLTHDFLYMGRFLVLGAALSAFVQTVVPQKVLTGVGGTPVISAVTLMVAAFALSLCSEADAFVAASFTSFSLSSQLAFLVFGPVLDAKLAVLYSATFRRRFVLRLLALAAPAVVLGTLALEPLLR